MGNIKSVETRKVSSSVMVNSTFVVIHKFFTVDIEYMLIYIRNNGKWELDVMDYCGVSNLQIDGVSMSSEDSTRYFDFLESVGVKHLDECCSMVEEVIKNMENDQVNEWVFNAPIGRTLLKWGVVDNPISDNLYPYNDGN